MFTRWTFTGGDCAETISWRAVQAAASKRVEIMTAVDRENNNYGISWSHRKQPHHAQMSLYNYSYIYILYTMYLWYIYIYLYIDSSIVHHSSIVPRTVTWWNAMCPGWGPNSHPGEWTLSFHFFRFKIQLLAFKKGEELHNYITIYNIDKAYWPHFLAGAPSTWRSALEKRLNFPRHFGRFRVISWLQNYCFGST